MDSRFQYLAGFLIVLLFAFSVGCSDAYVNWRTSGRPEGTKQLALDSGNSAQRPNVIMLMLDDLDNVTLQGALSANLMPNLKQHVIDRGVTFNRSYVTNAICCPSRATLLSGQYTHNHGVLNVKTSSGKSGLSYWLTASGATDKEYNTLATWVDAAGYRTGHVGKYLNGYGVDTTSTYVPPGYDEWHGLVDPTTYSMYGYTINDNGKTTTYGSAESDYQTDVLAGRAKSFIAGGSGDSPFMLILTPVAPHVEHGYETKGSSSYDKTIRPALRHLYLTDGDAANGEIPSIVPKRSVFEADLSDKTSQLKRSSALTKTDLADMNRQYKDRVAALAAVDDLIGTVVDELKVTGNYDRTVIIFTADNGWFYGEHRLNGKQWAYEEAIQVPLIIASPFHAGRGGSDALVVNIDLAPTIAELAGATVQRVVDGRSMVSLLGDPSGSTWKRQRFLVEQYIAGFGKNPESPLTYAAVRELNAERNTLFVNYFDQATSLSGATVFQEFYDLVTDPSEMYGITLSAKARAGMEGRTRCFAKCSGATCSAKEDAASVKPDSLPAQPEACR